jgi:hypothetical protein
VFQARRSCFGICRSVSYSGWSPSKIAEVIWGERKDSLSACLTTFGWIFLIKMSDCWLLCQIASMRGALLCPIIKSRLPEFVETHVKFAEGCSF